MEMMKMEEFYLFQKEDLPDFISLLKKEEANVKEDIPDGKEKRFLFLLRLVIDLLPDADRIRKLKNKFEGTYMDKGKGIVIEGFIKIVEEWLEQNDGNGNILEVIKVLRSNGHFIFASLMEQFLLRYSLPSSEDGSCDQVIFYSSLRDFLLVEEIKDTSMGSFSLWNANPVERALQNSVILEQVFRKLNASEQKAFRLVTSTWMNETFSYWRRSSVLQLHVPGNPDDDKIDGISMTSFVKLLDLEAKLSAHKRKGKNVGNNYRLMEHPFHRYQLSYNVFKAYQQKVPFSCGKKEDKFWQMCGSNIVDLEIDNAFFYNEGDFTLYKICEEILLETCPKLKKFKIGSSCRHELHYARDLGAEKNVKMNGKVASNLHTLCIDVLIRVVPLRRILFICPNLKALSFHTDWETRNALLYPTSNGECLKLEKLVVKYTGYVTTGDMYLPFRSYSEILIKKGFNCLQHLTLEGLDLKYARRQPFSLYAALANFSQTLKTLELEMKVDAAEDLAGDRKWFSELSPFAFPNLTVLKLSFTFDINGFMKRVHFDFGTLKGMPKLETFELRVRNSESFERNPGTQDWVFEGNRNEYLPEGVTHDYFSEEEPISCNNLKELTFIGWSLNEEDIQLLSAWFPNLTSLRAAMELELVPLLLENFTQLEKLDMETKELVSLGNLRRIREKKKGLRICQNISGKSPQSVEMKERNGRLYFANNNE